MAASTLSLDRCAAAMVAAALLLLAGCSSGDVEYVEPPPPSVIVAEPIVGEMTLFAEETGQLEAVSRAQVRARVRGFLEDILFEPGAFVEKGDELYRIEPDEYKAAQAAAEAAVAAAEAAITVAQAQVQGAEAQVEEAELNLSRQKKLLESRGTSRAEYETAVSARDTAIANRESAKASVNAAKAEAQKAGASLEQARLDLNYTTIRAPIGGRISKTDVKVGNLVEDGDLLATVVDISTMYANFSVSDREVLRYIDRVSKEDFETSVSQPAESSKPGVVSGRDWTSIKVLLRRETDDEFLFEGHLDYVDQTGVDVPTGTVGLRAVFDNADRRLIPGLFVYLRLAVDQLSETLMVPERVVSREPSGAFVLIVDSENIVRRQPIQIAAKQDQWVAVKSGLSPEQRVVIEGIQRARPGAKVQAEQRALERVGGTDLNKLRPPVPGGTTSEAKTGTS